MLFTCHQRCLEINTAAYAQAYFAAVFSQVRELSFGEPQLQICLSTVTFKCPLAVRVACVRTTLIRFRRVGSRRTRMTRVQLVRLCRELNADPAPNLIELSYFENYFLNELLPNFAAVAF
jgi:hypothetical protein